MALKVHSISTPSVFQFFSEGYLMIDSSANYIHTFNSSASQWLGLESNKEMEVSSVFSSKEAFTSAIKLAKIFGRYEFTGVKAKKSGLECKVKVELVEGMDNMVHCTVSPMASETFFPERQHKELENRIKLLEEQVLLKEAALNSTQLGLIISDEEGVISYMNPSVGVLLGKNTEGMKTIFEVFASQYGSTQIMKYLSKICRNGCIKEIMVPNAFFGKKYVKIVANKVEAFDQQPAKIIGVLYDVTEKITFQEQLQDNLTEMNKQVKIRTYQLERVIESLEEEISERKRIEEELTRSVEEKKILLHEIHHRVKNNMQVVASLLKLQNSKIESQEAKDIFLQCENRIRAMVLIHESIYNGTGLNYIEFDKYVGALFNYMLESHQQNNTSTIIKIDRCNISLEYSTPIGIILTELISNSFKHAFHDIAAPEIRIEVKAESNIYYISYSDNGCGYDTNYPKDKTLGLELVNGLIAQLQGKITYSSNNGANYLISFKDKGLVC
jgi:two-component sensor histidine kinase/PAS domain-containing protein